MAQKKIGSARPGRGAGTRPVAAALPATVPEGRPPTPSLQAVPQDAGRIREIFARLRDTTPEPKTELLYADPFTLLVAVALSAQATDVSVNKAAGPLFAVAGTPEAILALGEERLKGFIKTIGLYNSKARNVMALCDLLVQQHGGVVPRARELLEALARRRPQDRECRAQHHLGRARHRGRHTRLQGVEPDPPRGRRDAAGRRTRARRRRAG